ncbi:MAG: coiled-coil domain-containing protein 22 [bacterium]|nr:coiled-coil domain-containing protein 22 [bacterium]
MMDDDVGSADVSGVPPEGDKWGVVEPAAPAAEETGSREAWELAAEVARLREQNARLERSYDRLHKRERELTARFSQLLSELAEHRRDRARTYVSDSPQAHLIVESWKLLRDQEFRNIGRKILGLLPQAPDASIEARREGMAKLKSTLSREILMREYRRLRAIHRRVVLWEFVESLKNLPFEKAQRTAIAEVVESALAPHPTDGDGERTAPVAGAPESQEERLQTAAQRMWDLLGLDEAMLGDSLGPQIEALFAKGAELVAEVLHTEPPGELWMDEVGVLFDADRHQVELGCEEAGTIRWTSYPGYRHGDRVLCKAVVFTVPLAEPGNESEAA